MRGRLLSIEVEGGLVRRSRSWKRWFRFGCGMAGWTRQLFYPSRGTRSLNHRSSPTGASSVIYLSSPAKLFLTPADAATIVFPPVCA